MDHQQGIQNNPPYGLQGFQNQPPMPYPSHTTGNQPQQPSHAYPPPPIYGSQGLQTQPPLSYPSPINPNQPGGYPSPGVPNQSGGYPSSSVPYPSGGYPSPSVPYPPGGYPSPSVPNQPGGYPSPSVPNQPCVYPTNIQDQSNFYGPEGITNEAKFFAPTAPPADHLDPIPGYENTKFDIEVPIMPPPPTTPYEPPRYESGTINVVSLSEEEARDALYEYANDKCCYGTGVPSTMVVTKIDNTSAYYYKLETFAEGRKTAWKYEPYKDEPVLLYGTVPVPGPWEIPVQLPDQNFVNKKTSLEVPGTANIKICFYCNGGGVTPCTKCGQRGWIDCSSCKGKGCRKAADGEHEECPFCRGRGKDRCSPCKGNGVVKCDTCKGIKQLKHFIELKVTWTNYVDDYIVERTALPDECIKDAGGTVVFEEDQPMVGALIHFPDGQLTSGATKALQDRVVTVTKNERILRQRHKVTVVPVSEVNYQWKNKMDSYFVYGTNHKVYSSNYPQNCCWGWCSIL